MLGGLRRSFAWCPDSAILSVFTSRNSDSSTSARRRPGISRAGISSLQLSPAATWNRSVLSVVLRIEQGVGCARGLSSEVGHGDLTKGLYSNEHHRWGDPFGFWIRRRARVRAGEDP